MYVKLCSSNIYLFVDLFRSMVLVEISTLAKREYLIKRVNIKNTEL